MNHSPVYKAQVASFTVAKELAGNHANVSTMDDFTAQRAPFCLRIKKEYRHASTQQFRNLVAQRLRVDRKAGRQ